MALTKNEIKQYVLDIVNDDRGWNWTQWDDECHRLSVHVKYDQQLIDLETSYLNKLKRLYEHYQEFYDQLKFGVSESFITVTPEDAIAILKELKDKLRRIALKWNTVKAEIRGRSLGQFIRNPVGTVYYIDLDGGNDGADGLGTGTAWLTINKYTTTTVRSAGDIAYVRANTDETVGATDIICDDDGAINNPISIIGCDSVINDPWSDALDVKPIIDFNNGAFAWQFNNDYHWKLRLLEIKNNNEAAINGLISAQRANTRLYYCDIKGSNNATGIGVSANTRSEVYLEECTIEDIEGAALHCYASAIRMKGGSLDAGVGGGDYGINTSYLGVIELDDVDIGQSNVFSTTEIRLEYNSRLIMRNVRHNDDISLAMANVGFHPFVYSEDDNGVKGANKAWYPTGTITKDTGITRVGGADSSAKFEPNSYCGVDEFLAMHGDSLTQFPFKIWTAAALTTITIYIRSLGVWAAYPTVNELYLEANYLDESSGANRETIVTDESAHVLIDETTWIPFDLTFTPLQEGFVYLNVYLKKFEANKGCYVDIKPVVT